MQQNQRNYILVYSKHIIVRETVIGKDGWLRRGGMDLPPLFSSSFSSPGHPLTQSPTTLHTQHTQHTPDGYNYGKNNQNISDIFPSCFLFSCFQKRSPPSNTLRLARLLARARLRRWGEGEWLRMA